MSKKEIKLCISLNYIDHSLILLSTITGCVSISAFASWPVIPVGIKSSALGLNPWATTSRIKLIKSLIKEKNKREKAK